MTTAMPHQADRDRLAKLLKIPPLLPPAPEGDSERAIVDAIAEAVRDWFGEPQKWFRGCSESEAQIVGRQSLAGLKAALSRKGFGMSIFK